MTIETNDISPRSFLFEQNGAIATITLNRPDRLNSLTFEVYRELTDTFFKLNDRPDVRVVVITGAGRGFCSGGDVNDIIGELFSRDVTGLRAFTRMTCELIRSIRTLRKPVIASLNGTAAGAGAVIALASDIRVASTTAKIGFLFVKVGLAGADMGAAFLLPRVIGLGRATELLYTGEVISADQAYRIGLYNHLVEPEELLSKTTEIAETLARGPAFALGITKDALNREMHMTLESALEAEAEAQALCMVHSDFREAHDAFNEKRPPNFKTDNRKE